MPRRPAAFDEQRTGVVCRLRSYCCVGSGFIQSASSGSTRTRRAVKKFGRGSAPGVGAKDRTCASISDNQRSFCSWLASNHRAFISLDRCAILCRFQLGGLRQTDRSFRSFAFWLVVDHFEFPTLDLATGFEQLGFKRNPGFRIQLLLDLINDPLFQMAFAISNGLLSRAPPSSMCNHSRISSTSGLQDLV
jgi:hypothetical protein